MTETTETSETTAGDETTEDTARSSAAQVVANVVRATVRGVRAILRLWRYLYGENPLHLLSVMACFALSGYVVSLLWDDPSLIALGVWFAGAVLGHDLLLYPLYALADQPLVAGRWLRRRVLPRHPPLVPAVNHVRLPFLGSMVLGLIWFPSITGRGAEAFAFTAGHPMVGQYENWLLITGALFTGSAVIYALRLGAAAGRTVATRLLRPRPAVDATEAAAVDTAPISSDDIATTALPRLDPGPQAPHYIGSNDATEALPAARPADVDDTPGEAPPDDGAATADDATADDAPPVSDAPPVGERSN